jgi:hypothetical protein
MTRSSCPSARAADPSDAVKEEPAYSRDKQDIVINDHYNFFHYYNLSSRRRRR